MNTDISNFPYLHGFSDEEQERLLRQADYFEHALYRNVDFSDCERILEVGCGVGAQTEILLRRFPRLQITGIDSSDRQLATLQKRMEKGFLGAERFNFQKANAQDMDFEGGKFDGAFLCWILEHIPQPEKVLSEVKRVLKKGSPVYISEVMNSSFFLNPYSPNTWKYWMAFIDYQWENAGDPFVGAKLGNLLLSQGFQNIQTKVISLHFDNREPEKRRRTIQYWTELLLSAAPSLLAAECVSKEMVEGMKAELRAVSKNPEAISHYSFMQARAEV